ncbi:cobaltochelatase subunit CobN [Desulfobacula phenolica]|uniref:Cobaltochelatase CobN subunit n=1 Tax=Desulfobacula phenolica TaxID=90732 RepID=A0A1H2IC39_9BACT|nr:cobaltochelatase subunit CobN [Desulfobacula phenolica]SDU41689.1 cobaltochelatase CobN subunit [Desulfobacula phenolica]
MKIGAILSPFGPSRGIVVQTFGQAYAELKKGGAAFELRIENMAGAEQTMVEPDPDFLNWCAAEAEVILVLIPSAYGALFTELNAIGEKTGKMIIPLSPECMQVSNGVSGEELKRIWAYQQNGGTANIKNLLWSVLHLAGLEKEPPPLPIAMPLCGIYHPDHKEPFLSLDEYLAFKPLDENAYTVGLFFPRSYWIDNALDVIDALMETLLMQGANVIAVFNDKFKGEGDDVVTESFFMKNGTPLIDVLLMQAYFFLNSKREKNGAGFQQNETHVLQHLNVPTLLMINSLQSKAEYEENPEGLAVPQYIISIVLPEFDGISQPVLLGVTQNDIDRSTGATIQRPVPVPGQADYLAQRVLKWCALGKKNNADKRIAIILHNSPCRSGVEATVGAGFGLDTLESTALLLQQMEKQGYQLDWVPDNGRELIRIILEKKAISEFRWTPLEEIIKKGGAAGFVELNTYRDWLSELPDESFQKIVNGWGNPFSGDLSMLGDLEKMSLALYEGKITIPGLINGNVFIGLQPKRGCAGARCDGSVCKILHDPQVPPPHQYLAFYKWVERGFKADAMIHVGTHGNIELLPGKSVALSSSCFSHFCVGSLPHLYIYVVSNPMEGSIAKRRGLAVIVDHLHPVMASTRLYGPVAELEELSEEYYRAKSADEKGRLRELEKIIIESARQASIIREHDEFEQFDDFVEYIHGQMNMLTETMFRDGLHTLGQAPRGEQLISMLASILRFDQGQVHSLRRFILETIGLDYSEVLDQPEALSPIFNLTHARLLQLTEDAAKKIISQAVATQSDLTRENLSLMVSNILMEVFGANVYCLSQERTESLYQIVGFGLELLPAIAGTTQEIENIIRGLNAEFIEPGASGALARGKIETLPTGRNFYSIDPFKIPTPAAWNVGVQLAEKFFHKYLHEHDEYPENIGFVFRFFDIFRADGEQLAQMLYTLGVKPVWNGSRITGLEAIPLSQLQRPRVDITVQLSNMLRDGSPRAFELVDEAVRIVADLDEPPDQNFIRKHVMERMSKMQTEDDEKKKMRFATFRVFTAAPGVYDYGSNTAVAASAWETEEDLAQIFIDTCHYAYGKGSFGIPAKEEYKANLKQLTVTYDKWDSDEYDILDCCHIFGSHGGFTQAAKTISGNDIKVYFGDTHDPDRPRIRDMEEELDRVARTRLLNPEWIEGKKRHGYKGATVISDRVFHIYGWQATTRLVGNWVFDEIAQKFAIDPEMRKWFKENNIYAMESIVRRLMEAQTRELWSADPDLLEDLKEAYLEIEADLEEQMDDISSDFQGSTIEIIKKGNLKA